MPFYPSSGVARVRPCLVFLPFPLKRMAVPATWSRDAGPTKYRMQSRKWRASLHLHYVATGGNRNHRNGNRSNASWCWDNQASCEDGQTKLCR